MLRKITIYPLTYTYLELTKRISWSERKVSKESGTCATEGESCPSPGGHLFGSISAGKLMHFFPGFQQQACATERAGKDERERKKRGRRCTALAPFLRACTTQHAHLVVASAEAFDEVIS